MDCQNLLCRIVVIPLVICTLLACGETEDTSPVALSETLIEKDTASFSGRVVDETGNPVAGLDLTLRPRRIDTNIGAWAYVSALEAETDEAGHFSIIDILPMEFQFMLLPENWAEHWNGLSPETEYQLLSIKIGDMTYHLNDGIPLFFTRNTFSITPGMHIENVEVTVRLRMRIRAKIVFANGTPLTNKEIDINIRAHDLHENNVGGVQGTVQTDAQGYFVQYVDRNKPISYRVSVEYKGLCATSEIFVLKVGERRENLILKLPGAPR